jgi:hypothetical protein
MHLSNIRLEKERVNILQSGFYVDLDREFHDSHFFRYL